MSLIKWTTGIPTIDPTSEEATFRLLAMTQRQMELRWLGELIIRPKAHKHQVEVKLRKNIGAASLVITFNKNLRKIWKSKVIEDRGISISMNGTASFTLDELDEMNLVIVEGKKVYDEAAAIFVKNLEQKNKNKK